MSLFFSLLGALLFTAFGWLIVVAGNTQKAAGRLRRVAFLASLGVFALTVALVSPMRLVAFLAAAPMTVVVGVLGLSIGISAVVITELLRAVIVSATTWTAVKHRNVVVSTWIILVRAYDLLSNAAPSRACQTA